MQKCANAEVAQDIGKLLLDDKIALGTDGSNKFNLICILEDIGTASEAHFLSESVRKNLSRERYVDGDTDDVFFCLEKMMLRAEKQEDQAEIKRVMEDINHFRGLNGLRRLDETLKIPWIEKTNNLFEDKESDQFLDEDTDNKIGEEYYKQGKMLSAVERLEIVKNLRIAARKEKNHNIDPEEPDNFLCKHSLEYNEKNPSKHGVTIGIEIEIPEKSVLSKEIRKKAKTEDFREFRNEYLKYRNKFIESERLGVPEGEDGNTFWEFAHEPARNPLTISREVQALIGMGLINKEYYRYPLHVTVGGISSKGYTGGEAHLLSHAMEATGWSTNSYRLTRPFNTKNGSWSQKGKGSLQERKEEFGDETNTEKMKSSPEQGIGGKGVEFRSLQFQSLSGLDRHLHSIFYLGTALRAFQEKAEKKDKCDDIMNELSGIWKTFSTECSKLFKLNELDDPTDVWRVDYFLEYLSPFKDLAKILDEGTTKPKSESAKFIHDIRLLIIQTRTKVKEILEKEKISKK